ncbi:MAG: protease [Sulfuricurvum sp. PC08-66]|nr:MAG: protease [Sulfuricurvum sp. PC08-66]
MEAFEIFMVAIVVVAFVLIVKGVKIVPQAEAWVVERLGRYHMTLEGGFHLIIPVIDTVRMTYAKQEQLIDIAKQPVITKDNVNIQVDGIVFIQVEDARKATYGIMNFKSAIANLAMTTLRAEIGQMNLDETLSSRDGLNVKILGVLDEASGKWGVKTMRVEISDISVPREIEEAMNMQMKAEREKRAIELKAIANKEAMIRDAEGLKQKTVLEAEAIERMADAKRYEQEQMAQGQMTAMKLINEQMSTNARAAEFMLAKDRVAAFEKLASSDSKDKMIVPYETMELIGSLSVFKEFLTTKATKA